MSWQYYLTRFLTTGQTWYTIVSYLIDCRILYSEERYEIEYLPDTGIALENCPWASVSTWKYRCITPNMPPFVLLHICYKVPARYFCARLSFLTRTICAVAFINTHFNNKEGETISHNFWHSTSVIHCYANSIHCLLRNCKMRCLENCCNQQCSSAFLLWHFFEPTLHIFTASTKWIVRNSGTRCHN